MLLVVDDVATVLVESGWAPRKVADGSLWLKKNPQGLAALRKGRDRKTKLEGTGAEALSS